MKKEAMIKLMETADVQDAEPLKRVLALRRLLDLAETELSYLVTEANLQYEELAKAKEAAAHNKDVAKSFKYDGAVLSPNTPRGKWKYPPEVEKIIEQAKAMQEFAQANKTAVYTAGKLGDDLFAFKVKLGVG